MYKSSFGHPVLGFHCASAFKNSVSHIRRLRQSHPEFDPAQNILLDLSLALQLASSCSL